jgi:hypothetical protein
MRKYKIGHFYSSGYGNTYQIIAYEKNGTYKLVQMIYSEEGVYILGDTYHGVTEANMDRLNPVITQDVDNQI